jgi:hypothetical protein
MDEESCERAWKILAAEAGLCRFDQGEMATPRGVTAGNIGQQHDL